MRRLSSDLFHSSATFLPLLPCRRLIRREFPQEHYRAASGPSDPLGPSAPLGPSIPRAVEDLPPWPIDDIEYNTRDPSGGHDTRRAHERDTALLTGLLSPLHDGPSPSLLMSPSVVAAPPVLSAEQKAAVRRVEATADGAAALAAGGWVCASCLRCAPLRSRSVCGHCHALRHDAAETVERWRQHQTNWICARCREFNFERDAACRCCKARREEQLEQRVAPHERVADEIARAAVGSVIVTKNRVSRWRCVACAESNALQSSTCRNCARGRFEFPVWCPNCKAKQSLSNPRMFGAQPADHHAHALRSFGLHNCFPRLAPEQRCEVCHGALHGAATSSRSDAWLCACGLVINGAAVSCPRCRAPRRLSQPAALEELLRVWDFAGCTNWYCEGCDMVNKASRHVVAIDRYAREQRPTTTTTTTTATSSATTPTGRNKTVRILHGVTNCERCGLPWHHQRVSGGQHWRCACHMVNRSDDTRCGVCMLPALDGIRADVLSFWTRGDWYCPKCQRQNYREKSTCTCGEERPRD